MPDQGSFQDRLLRLKECLGLPEDQQIAEALGMTKAAFSERKRRGTFPDERVVAAKARYHDLDVTYVLSGQRARGKELVLLDEMHRVSAGQSTEIQRAAIDAVNAHFGLTATPVNDRHRSLVQLLPWCDDEALDLLIKIAGRFVASSNRRLDLHEKPAPYEAKPKTAPVKPGKKG